MKNHLLVCLGILFLTSCGPSKYHSSKTDLINPPLARVQTKKTIIAIDPGHGGKDEGAHGNNPPYQEKQLTLVTSLILKKYLEGMGYQTIITRGDDTFIPLKARACFANSNDIDIFVSVHYNAAESKSAHGIEIFYYKSDKDPVRTTESKVLADLVLDKVIAQTQAKSRGVKHGNLAVVRETKMPAILVEGGFLTNEEERNKILNIEYCKRLAWGIATGVREYTKMNGIGSSSPT